MVAAPARVLIAVRYRMRRSLPFLPLRFCRSLGGGQRQAKESLVRRAATNSCVAGRLRPYLVRPTDAQARTNRPARSRLALGARCESRPCSRVVAQELGKAAEPM